MKKILFSCFALVLLGCFCFSGCQKDDLDGSQAFESGDYPMLGPSANLMAGFTVPMDPITIDQPTGSNSFTVAGIATYIANNVSSGLLSYAGGKLGEYLYSIVDPSEVSNKELKEILTSISLKVDTIQAQLSTITNQLNEVCEQLRDIDATVVEIRNVLTAQVYLNYRRDLIAINNLNKEYFEEVEGAVYDTVRLRETLDRWATETVNGNPSRLAAKNLADLLYDGSMTSADPCKVYDMIAYNTIPWESQGYDLRDEFRAADALIILRGLQLSYMYYLLHDNHSMAQEVANTASNLAKYYDYHSVVRHNDVAICQIRGAHLKLNKKIKDISSFSLKSSDYINGRQMMAAHAYGADINVPSETQIVNYANQLFSQKEIDAICTFYQSIGESNKSFLSVLCDDAGLELPEINRSSDIYMMTQDFNATCYDQSVYFDVYTFVDYSVLSMKSKVIVTLGDFMSTGPVYSKPVSVIERGYGELDTKDRYNGWTENHWGHKYQCGYYKRWKLPDGPAFTFPKGNLVWVKVEQRMY